MGKKKNVTIYGEQQDNTTTLCRRVRKFESHSLYLDTVLTSLRIVYM